MSIIKNNKSGIFLMELMVVVIFILLSVTICVNIFFEGQKLSKKSYILTNAVIESENAAQLLNYDNGKLDSLVEYYRAEIFDESIVIYFDDKFQICSDKEKYIYEMKINQNFEEDKLIYSDIIVLDIKDKTIIYTLKTAEYAQEDI